MQVICPRFDKFKYFQQPKKNWFKLSLRLFKNIIAINTCSSWYFANESILISVNFRFLVQGHILCDNEMIFNYFFLIMNHNLSEKQKQNLWKNYSVLANISGLVVLIVLTFSSIAIISYRYALNWFVLDSKQS